MPSRVGARPDRSGGGTGELSLASDPAGGVPIHLAVEVSGISSDAVLVSALGAAQASNEASVRMLDMALDLVASQQAQLLEALKAGSPAGVGGSVDTFG